MRKKTAAASLVLALALGAAACGSDESVGPGDWTLDDLEGTWEITRYQYTADEGSDVFDLIDNGFSGEIEINSDGTYVFTLDAPGLPNPIVTNGTFTIDASGNVVDSEEGGTIDIERDGDTITIRDESVTFDFDDDPETPEEPADALIIWQKQ